MILRPPHHHLRFSSGRVYHCTSSLSSKLRILPLRNLGLSRALPLSPLAHWFVRGGIIPPAVFLCRAPGTPTTSPSKYLLLLVVCDGTPYLSLPRDDSILFASSTYFPELFATLSIFSCSTLSTSAQFHRVLFPTPTNIRGSLGYDLWES